MSQREVNEMHRAAADVDAEGIHYEFRQLCVRHVQRLEAHSHRGGEREAEDLVGLYRRHRWEVWGIRCYCAHRLETEWRCRRECAIWSALQRVQLVKEPSLRRHKCQRAGE